MYRFGRARPGPVSGTELRGRQGAACRAPSRRPAFMMRPTSARSSFEIDSVTFLGEGQIDFWRLQKRSPRGVCIGLLLSESNGSACVYSAKASPDATTEGISQARRRSHLCPACAPAGIAVSGFEHCYRRPYAKERPPRGVFHQRGPPARLFGAGTGYCDRFAERFMSSV
jgi:hypothetical protein